MVELLKAIEEGLLIVIRGIHSIGEFILDPGEGSAIAFTWIFGPLLAYAGVQKIKRVLLEFKLNPPGWLLEGLGTSSCVLICWVMLVGLWDVDSKVWVHIFLISWMHMVFVNAWMNFLKRYCPILFKSFRSRRRTVDAPSRAQDPKSYDRYNADPDTTVEMNTSEVSRDQPPN